MAAPEDNTNAEIWDIETATKFMNDAVELSKDPEYDFIGEVAYDLDQDKGVFDYLIGKFPELKRLKNRIKHNCEVNCFRNTKKGSIKEATGIVNLKSNHGWTDRSESNNKNTNINHNSVPLEKDEINKIANELNDEF